MFGDGSESLNRDTDQSEGDRSAPCSSGQRYDLKNDQICSTSIM